MREDGRHQPIHLSNWWHGNQSLIVFLTVCSDKRKPILATPETAEVLVKSWKTAEGWAVGRYVILPDHIHLFCAPSSFEPPALKRWVEYWKRVASRQWPRPEEHPVWQRDFWDRQLRSGESYESKWLYVFNNPVRHGLVSRAEDWPFSGVLNELSWNE